jgi:hypothetical protein
MRGKGNWSMTGRIRDLRELKNTSVQSNRYDQKAGQTPCLILTPCACPSDRSHHEEHPQTD